MKGYNRDGQQIYRKTTLTRTSLCDTRKLSDGYLIMHINNNSLIDNKQQNMVIDIGNNNNLKINNNNKAITIESQVIV